MKCWRCEERIGKLAKITAYAAPELACKTAEEGFICPYCGPQYGDGRQDIYAPSYFPGVARHYFKDGTIELRVRPERRTWAVLRRPKIESVSLCYDGIGTTWSAKRHTLTRRDYAYGVDFIGPLRDSDWHED